MRLHRHSAAGLAPHKQRPLTLGSSLAHSPRPRKMTSCCPAAAGNGAVATANGAAGVSKVGDLTSAVTISSDAAAVKASVSEYYGQVLQSSNDLKTSACCTAAAPPPLVKEALKKVPDEIKSRYYGCGSPIPMGITGLRVLDLGCGTGRDCYVCAALVGPSGHVTGVDMTPEQLAVAEKYKDSYCRDSLGYSASNMAFVAGEIEALDKAGLGDGCVDLVISNCVINLSPDKAAVLREAYRVLAPGGEMYFSDVYCDRRLPAAVRSHPVLLGECLGGALYVQDFLRLARAAGFNDPRSLSVTEIEVRDGQLRELLGEARFYSITYRLFKIPGRLETLCEDYGQVAVYKGSIPGHSSGYDLDDHHRLVTGKPMLVCGNTASMLQETWLKDHFVVTGDRSVHYGLFDCSSPAPAAAAGSSGACAPGACC